MKALALLLLVFSAMVHAAPKLLVDRSWGASSPAKVRFDTPMVAVGDLKKEKANTVFVLKPKCEGVIHWEDERTAVFVPTEVPIRAPRYQVTLAKGLKDLAGNTIASQKLGSLALKEFSVRRPSRHHPNYENPWSPRTGAWVVEANAAIDLKSAKKRIRFVANDGEVIAVEVQRLPEGEYRSWDHGWDTRWQMKIDGVEATTSAPPNQLLVTPAKPLTIGKEWELVVKSRLKSALPWGKTDGEIKRRVGRIDRLEISSMQAVTVVDEPRRIVVKANLVLAKEQPEDLVRVSPLLKGMGLKVSTESGAIVIDGDFSRHDEYTVTIAKGLRTLDGRRLAETVTKKVEFEHLPTGLALHSSNESQLASGHLLYVMDAQNASVVNVRAKRVTGIDLVRAMQAYRQYQKAGRGQRRHNSSGLVPYSLIVGETVLDGEVELDGEIDTLERFAIDWAALARRDKNVLTRDVDLERGAPGTDARGAYFVEAHALKHEELSYRDKERVAQAIVQITEIGIGWKIAEDSTSVFAFSTKTGKPMAGVQLVGYGEAADELRRAVTDESGLATMPIGDEMRHLHASKAGDEMVVSYDDRVDTVGMWQFDLDTYNPASPTARKVAMFTDRSLYRPGESVHLKGIVRRWKGAEVELDQAQARVEMQVSLDNQVLSSQAVEVSESGDFDLLVDLPEKTVGPLVFQLLYPDELVSAESEEDWRKRRQLEASARFEHRVMVQEFRRNEFKVEVEIDAASTFANLTGTVQADYFYGEPVAGGNVRVNGSAIQENFFSEKYRNYLFHDYSKGMWPYWQHYYRWSGDFYNEGDDLPVQGDVASVLSEDGSYEFALSVGAADFPKVITANVAALATSPSEQSLMSQARKTFHSADFYLGVGKSDEIQKVGKTTDLAIIALRPEEEQLVEGVVEVSYEIERDYHEQVALQTESGARSVRNEKKTEVVASDTITLANGQGNLAFAPTESGSHRVKLTAKDVSGRVVKTVVAYEVYGTEAFPWEYGSAVKMEIVAERETYRPGETAKLLVLTPIEGTALVTYERDGVLKSFVREIEAENRVIEVPVTVDEAPNVYVSVMVVQGADGSARKVQQPRLRMGYVNLRVEDPAKQLTVEVAAGLPDGLVKAEPGAEVVVAGKVVDAMGVAVAGAKVTVYAVDEGSLAVMGYDNPDLSQTFHADRSLAVNTGTSLSEIMLEDFDEIYGFNKGYFVGGGDELMLPSAGAEFDASGIPDMVARADFTPTAFWLPNLVTDLRGEFRVTAQLSDTLTAYRLIAVVHAGADRFGTGTGELIVSKDVLIEPQTPRFAQEGDELVLTARVRNTTDVAGEWKVALHLPEGEGSPIAHIAGDVVQVVSAQTISLGPKAEAVVRVPVRFAGIGELALSWSAVSVSYGGRPLAGGERQRFSDLSRSTIEVAFPAPAIRAREVRRLDPGTDVDVMKWFDPNLTAGRGTLELQASPSILALASGAMDHLLRYPYGCVEQTSSSMLPWLALRDIRAVAPELVSKTDEEIELAIAKGIRRLQSMMTDSGGLAYWQGGTSPSRWGTSHAALVLLEAKRCGADVPKGLLGEMQRYLDGLEPGDGSARAARELWVLARMGAAVEARVTKMLGQEMDEEMKCYLALALAEGGHLKRARELFARPTRENSRHWMRYRNVEALRIFTQKALGASDADTGPAVQAMLAKRTRRGDWGTTYANGWALMALGAVARDEVVGNRDFVVEVRPENGAAGALQKDVAQWETDLAAGGVKLRADQPVWLIANLEAFPAEVDVAGLSHEDASIVRVYEREKADGTWEPLVDPQVGDLIRVTLKVDLQADGLRYLAVEDRLPPCFEAINEAFASQGGQRAGARGLLSHQEVRGDRVVFFYDYIDRRRQLTMSYRARCVIAGEATAPAAKVEAMYDPELRAVTGGRRFTAAAREGQ